MRQTWVATRKEARRRRAAGILAASIIFHGAIFLLAFSRAGGDLVSAGDAGGGPQGPAFAVTLVRLPSPVLGEQLSQPTPPMQRLKLRPTARDDGIVVGASAEIDRFAALAERLTSHDRSGAPAPQRYPMDRVQPQGSYAADDRRLSASRSRTAQTDQGSDGTTSGTASTGSLWGAIEPCWQNLAFRGQVAVTIDVALNARGRLQGPPQVVRSASALLSEPRLKSEANALAALAACMPRGDVRLAAARYRLEFPATPGRP